MKFLCVGHVTYDVTFSGDFFPLENTKNRYHTQDICAGGSAAIIAFLLAKWREEVEFAGIVGNDDKGKRIKKEFILNRVGINNLVLNDDVSTSHSLILANRTNGSRTVFCYVSKYDKLKPLKLDYNPDVLIFDGHESEASLKLLLSYPKALSIMDASRDKKEVIELAKKVNYVVCSREFAQSVTGVKIDFNDKQSLVLVYSKMETIFNNTIIITLGGHGVIYKQNDSVKIMPSIRVKTIDSTGAGNIFRGAFAYALMKDFSLEKALKFSNVAGALSVTRVGGYHSIPSLEEVQEVYEQVK